MHISSALTTLSLLGFLILPTITLAGSLTPPGAPSAGSGMPTLQGIHDQLNSGATATVSSSFQEPSSGPAAGTGKSLSDIKAKLPALDDASGATAGDVLSGKTFWGLRTGAWGTATGSMPNNGAVTITPSASAQTIAAGYHNGSGTVTGDANLVSGNIKSGKSIFGVTGILSGGYTCTGTMNGTRWCDNNNGTVRDMTTGLIWLKDASWGGSYPWDTTLFDRVSTLANGATLPGTSSTLTDGSAAGDWRMPTKAELVALTTGTEAVRYATPRVFSAVQWDFYWSSSGISTSYAWRIYMSNGVVTHEDKSTNNHVWPVRSGE